MSVLDDTNIVNRASITTLKEVQTLSKELFEENKKSADGQYARTTHDQYGEVLHRYTIKNALEDGAVLGFQVEHESTIHEDEIANVVYRAMRADQKNISFTDEELVSAVESMKDIDKEGYLQNAHYESDDHILSVNS